MHECWRCMPIGPTPEEQQRRHAEALEAEVAAMRTYFDSPEGRRILARTLRTIGWTPKEEGT